MMKAPPADQPATQIRSVARAAALLLHIAASPDGISATDAAKVIGTAVPTAYHLLTTLRVAGLLAQDARRRFVLGPQAAVVAEAWLRSEAIPEFLLEPLRELARRTGETAYLAAWRQEGIRALASVAGAQAVRVAEAERGPYRSPHARATGKLLLAHADPARRAAVLGDGPLAALTANTITDPGRLEAEFARIRAQGWAEDREEFLEGVACVSAPVLVGGVVVASLTVSAPSQRFAIRREELIAAVLQVAAEAGDKHADTSMEVA